MGFKLLMVLVLLVMLNALALMPQAIRLPQDKVEGIEKELQLVNEEIKMLLRRGTEGDLSDWAKAEGLQESSRQTERE